MQRIWVFLTNLSIFFRKFRKLLVDFSLKITENFQTTIIVTEKHRLCSPGFQV